MKGLLLKLRGTSQIVRNRIIWLVILVSSFVYAWITGERILFVASAVMFVLPIASVVLSRYFLARMKVSQTVPRTVLKNDLSQLTVRFHNHSIMPFGSVECVFYGDENALRMPEREKLFVRPLRTTEYKLAFTALYRGHFLLGIKAIEVMDITGLFGLRKNFGRYVEVTSMPLIKDIKAFPLNMNTHTQAQARNDLRDEDYATISDIREYMPTDSIKRVHWKLTAKKGEWLVKIFQSNAQSRVSVILDSLRLDVLAKEMYPLEDHMVETTVAVVKYSLMSGIPVDFFATESFKSSARAMGEFNAIYNATGSLKFDKSPPLSSLSILTHLLNEAAGYVNAIIISASLNHDLSERILTATNNGHSITVLYFSVRKPSADSDRIFALLSDSGVTVFNITDEFSFVN